MQGMNVRSRRRLRSDADHTNGKLEVKRETALAFSGFPSKTADCTVPRFPRGFFQLSTLRPSPPPRDLDNLARPPEPSAGLLERTAVPTSPPGNERKQRVQEATFSDSVLHSKCHYIFNLELHTFWIFSFGSAISENPFPFYLFFLFSLI